MKRNFPGSPVVKNPLVSTRDTGWIPVQEDPTDCGATKPKHHDYNLTLSSPGAHVSQLLKPEHPRAHDLQQEKSHRGEKPEQQS